MFDGFARLLRYARRKERFPAQSPAASALLRGAGFDPDLYRQPWPDLVAALPTERSAVAHYLTYLEYEIRTPRVFPLDLDVDRFARIARSPVLSRFAKASLARNLVQGAIDYRPEIVTDAGFWRGVLPTLARIGRTVIVAGDSHSRVFRQTIPHWRRPIIPLNLLCGGGSASGLPKPSSRSGYGQRIAAMARALSQAEPRDVPTLGFAFGQVDVEFVHTYQRVKRGEFRPDPAQFEAFVDEVTSRYVDWIADLPLRPCAILGINPPCVDDEFIKPAYFAQTQTYAGAGVDDARQEHLSAEFLADFERLEFPDQKQRTSESRRFNAALAASAKGKLLYLDSFDAFLGPNGLTRPEFTFASNGVALVEGRAGADIHVGGEGALGVKARLIRDVERSSRARLSRRR